jgi:hypothetical protein
MSFIGPTEERLIKTTEGKTFKIFITQQDGGYWIATVFHAKDGVVDTHNIADSDKAEAFRKASEWTLNNIDDKATIETL